jgi:hypothetical protein
VVVLNIRVVLGCKKIYELWRELNILNITLSVVILN